MEIKEIILNDIPEKTKKSLRELEKKNFQNTYYIFNFRPNIEQQLKDFFKLPV